MDVLFTFSFVSNFKVTYHKVHTVAVIDDDCQYHGPGFLFWITGCISV